MTSTDLASTEAGTQHADIFSKLQDLLKEILILESTESLKPETRFLEDLNLDSMGMVDIVIGLEEGFGISISSSTNIFEEVKTIDDAANLVLKMSNASN